MSSQSSPDMAKVFGKVPKFLYGTAWKKERTEKLVYQALKAGFRAVDCAAQPRHYREDLVGKGIKRAIQEGIVTRKELYIQTKFTSPSGQDLNDMPYDVSLPMPDQIRTSVASSLKNFTFSEEEEPYIDCLVLHSPYSKLSDTQQAWQTLEVCTYERNNPIRSLGISNVDITTLQSLVTQMDIPPAVVQNRLYAKTGFEVPIRRLCREKGIIFQGFWTLTANPELMRSNIVREVAAEIQKREFGKVDSVSIALYSLMMGLEGVSILNGTTKTERMKNDLEASAEIEKLIVGEWKDKWSVWMNEFKKTIGEPENTSD